MGRAAENSASSVFHEDEIGHVQGKRPFVIEGMTNLDTGVVTDFFRHFDGRLAGSGAAAFGNERPKIGVILRQVLGKRVVCGDSAKRGAENGIWTGGEDF